tara:strand:+ start:226 stop:435 length:210 start_codon:yes stop_codon:yes gene_type:complete
MKKMKTMDEFKYKDANLGMRIFLSLSMQQALMGLQLFELKDETSKEMDNLLVEMIMSAANVIFEKPIEA